MFLCVYEKKSAGDLLTNWYLCRTYNKLIQITLTVVVSGIVLGGGHLNVT